MSGRGRLLAGQILYARNEEEASSAVTVTIPDAWLELPAAEFAERIEDSFDRMRRVFNEVWERKRGEG